MKILHKALFTALSLKRPHGGNGVKLLSRWIRRQLPATAFCDPIGNVHFDNRKDDQNRTLFVAHMDTVHREDGVNKFEVIKDRQGTILSVKAAGGKPLGADDGAGCALLMHLIEYDVPGYYIFTQGEEKGGIGAMYLAEKWRGLLEHFDRAIAFDRKSTHSIITHQWGSQCASTEFAETLADALNDLGCLYAPDDTGLYTDTAEFVGLIPECTNISAGYFNEHTSNEWLDMEHFDQLAKAIVKIDWDALPIGELDEVPSDAYPPYYSYQGSYPQEEFDHYGYSKYPTYNKYLDTIEKDSLEFLLAEADRGLPRDLLKRVAQWAHPSDPDHALKFISAKNLTPQLIDDCFAILDLHNEELVLSRLWNDLYIQ